MDDILEEHACGTLDRSAQYDDVFEPELSSRQRDWIERRLNGKARGFDDLDTLLGNCQRVVAWARRKAQLADGTKPGIAVVDPRSAMCAVESAPSELTELTARPQSGRRHAALDLMRVALLRDASGESFVSIARRLGMSPSTPKKQYRLHGECMDDAEYGLAYAALISEALHALHGWLPARNG